MWPTRISLGVREKNNSLIVIRYQKMLLEGERVSESMCGLIVTDCKSFFLDRKREKSDKIVDTFEGEMKVFVW